MLEKSQNITELLKNNISGKMKKYWDFLEFFKLGLSDVFLHTSIDEKKNAFQELLVDTLSSYSPLFGSVTMLKKTGEYGKPVPTLFSSTSLYSDTMIPFFFSDFLDNGGMFAHVSFDHKVSFSIPARLFSDDKIDGQDLFSKGNIHISGFNLGIDTSFYGSCELYDSLSRADRFNALNNSIYDPSDTFLFMNTDIDSIVAAEYFSNEASISSIFSKIKDTEKMRIINDLNEYFSVLRAAFSKYYSFYLEKSSIEETCNTLIANGEISAELVLQIGFQSFCKFLKKYYNALSLHINENPRINYNPIENDSAILKLSLLNNLFDSPSLLVTMDADYLVLGKIIRYFLAQHKEKYKLDDDQLLLAIFHKIGEEETNYNEIVLK